MALADKISKYPPIIPLFISVDPDRDTPERIQKYLSGGACCFVEYAGTPIMSLSML